MYGLQLIVTKNLSKGTVKQGGKTKGSKHLVSLSGTSFGFLIRKDALKENKDFLSKILTFSTKSEAKKFNLNENVLNVFKGYTTEKLKVVKLKTT